MQYFLQLQDYKKKKKIQKCVFYYLSDIVLKLLGTVSLFCVWSS